MFFKRKPKNANPTSARSPRRAVASRSSEYSYYSDRSDTTRPTQAIPRKSVGKPKIPSPPKQWLKQLPTILAVCLIIFCVVYELGLSSNPKITILGNVTTTQKLFIKPISEYQQVAQKLFTNSLSNRNKLSVNTASIATHMQQQFPELASVSVTLPLIGHRPIIYIEPAKPELFLSSQNSGLFLIDTSGKVLSKVSEAQTQTSTLPIVTDQSNITVTPGKVALAESDVAFIQLAVSQFQAQHIEIKSIVLPAATRELDIYIGGMSYFVKFNLNDSSNAKQQIGTYLAIRQYLASHNILPKQYVDARVVGRAYYQ